MKNVNKKALICASLMMIYIIGELLLVSFPEIFGMEMCSDEQYIVIGLYVGIPLFCILLVMFYMIFLFLFSYFIDD